MESSTEADKRYVSQTCIFSKPPNYLFVTDSSSSSINRSSIYPWHTPSSFSNKSHNSDKVLESKDLIDTK